MAIELSARQQQILEIVRLEGPITGEQIAEKLNLTRATLRPDLAILTMAGFLEARPRVGYFYAGKKTSEIFGEQLRKMLVKDHKAVPVVISENATVYDAIVAMFVEDVGNLSVVKDHGILAGVISRKDLLKVAIGKQETQSVPVSLVMTRMPNVITVTGEDNVYNAARKLVENAVDSLPVVKVLDAERKQYEVIGRFTKTTVTKIFVELGSNREI
ncbi:helix-turn-helix transcriptional regulator [Effusibacillus lacus]|uniref:Transcriptional regulator n=1 Tax=Effusibacillus lacus TaxID=1348429 RepID=A0A292YK69_9BACL|nr:helix-turn-helix transcriptional regulator [Effusibacillus lacus]TCS70353.1 CBS domain protein [Effusibacillus lacus]GAX91507.1 transcriptional regulator [Effusibacillus lacus]